MVEARRQWTSGASGRNLGEKVMVAQTRAVALQVAASGQIREILLKTEHRVDDGLDTRCK